MECKTQNLLVYRIEQSALSKGKTPVVPMAVKSFCYANPTGAGKRTLKKQGIWV